MAKDWYYSESLSLQSTSTTGGTTAANGVVALSSTHDLDAGDWMVLWSFDLGMDGVPIATGEEAAAAVVVDGVITGSWRITSPTEDGFRNFTAFDYKAGLSAGNHTFSVRFGRNGVGILGAQIKNIRQVVIQMNRVPGAQNAFASVALATVDDISYVDHSILTFTPNTNNDRWVVLANAEIKASDDAAVDNAEIKLTLDGVDLTNRHSHYFPAASLTERHLVWFVATPQLTNSSHTIALAAKMAPDAAMLLLARIRLFAFNLSRWPGSAFQESTGEETFSSQTYQTKTNPLDYTPSKKTDHAWICGWVTNSKSIAVPVDNQSFIGAPTSTEAQILHDISSSLSLSDPGDINTAQDYICHGLIYVLTGSQITSGTSPGQMADRVRTIGFDRDVNTKGYVGFVLRRLLKVSEPIRSGGMVVPFER